MCERECVCVCVCRLYMTLIIISIVEHVCITSIIKRNYILMSTHQFGTNMKVLLLKQHLRIHWNDNQIRPLSTEQISTFKLILIRALPLT